MHAGEGIYHWEGMTDDEDEEWDPEGANKRKPQGGKVEKVGHLALLPPLLSVSCLCGALAVCRCLSLSHAHKRA